MGKLMLVDDDRDDRSFFVETLKFISPETVCMACKSGREALSRLNVEKNLPDLILLDINMPEMSGWEFLTSIKRNQAFYSIPVIMYSTSSHDRDVRIAEDFGAVGFCTKPEDMKQLENLLRFITDNIERISRESLLNSGVGCFKAAK